MSEVKVKLLVLTETFNKDKSPYLLSTAIDLHTNSKNQFDYNNIYNREDKYKDLVGFYIIHPVGYFGMSSEDITTMEQWVKCLGKSLVCLVECDGVINAWLFSREESGKVSNIDIKASTANNINYYIWTEPTPSFWQNADFLTKGEAYQDEFIDPFTEITDRLDNVEAGMMSIINAVEALTTAIQSLEPTEENETENKKKGK
jgi:hypothetical protein